MLLRKAPHNESMSDVPPQQSKSSGTEEHPVIALFLDPLVCTSGFFVAMWKSSLRRITSKTVGSQKFTSNE
jgi:hypothetical protein